MDENETPATGEPDITGYDAETGTFEGDGTTTPPPEGQPSNEQTTVVDTTTTESADGTGRTIDQVIDDADQQDAQDENITDEAQAQRDADAAGQDAQDAANADAEAGRANADEMANNDEARDAEDWASGAFDLGNVG